MTKEKEDESPLQKFQKLILEKHPNIKFPNIKVLTEEEIKSMPAKFTESIQVVPIGEKTPWQKLKEEIAIKGFDALEETEDEKT